MKRIPSRLMALSPLSGLRFLYPRSKLYRVLSTQVQGQSPSQLLESIGKLTPDAQSNTNYNPSSLSTHLELGVVMK